MEKPQRSKLKVALITAAFALGLTANSAQAHHYQHVIAPLATVAALTYLFNHNQHHHYSYKRKRHYGHGHHHGHQNHHRRKHSHSYGGYSHKSRHHYQH